MVVLLILWARGGSRRELLGAKAPGLRNKAALGRFDAEGAEMPHS